MFEMVKSLWNPPSSVNDWNAIKQQLLSYDPNDGNFYLIVVNKGIVGSELRSRFLSYQEALSLINSIIEKK